MSTLYVDNLQPNLGSGVSIPGHVVQTVYSTNTSQLSTTSTSETSTGLSVTITPHSSSSNIKLTAYLSALRKSGDNTMSFFWYRNGSKVETPVFGLFDTSDTQLITDSITPISFDAPSSASSQTYTLYWKSNGGATVWLNVGNWGKTVLMAEEIAQ